MIRFTYSDPFWAVYSLARKGPRRIHASYCTALAGSNCFPDERRRLRRVWRALDGPDWQRRVVRAIERRMVAGVSSGPTGWIQRLTSRLSENFMLNRAGVLRVVFAGFLLACSSHLEDSAGTAEKGTLQGVRERYQLLRIGGTSPLMHRQQALSSCDLRPFHAWYAIESGQWASGDSVFVNCGDSPIDTSPNFRLTSGTYKLQGDTIDFFVRDSTIGVRGLVNRGLLRHDTLLIWGSDMDGGDYIFVRIRK